eukprot:scaffold42800_cov52-Attheya_sp.AAC.6
MSNSISKTSSPQSVSASTPVAVHQRRTPLGSLNLQSTRRNSNNRVNTDTLFKLQKENFLIVRDLINKSAAIKKAQEENGVLNDELQKALQYLEEVETQMMKTSAAFQRERDELRMLIFSKSLETDQLRSKLLEVQQESHERWEKSRWTILLKAAYEEMIQMPNRLIPKRFVTFTLALLFVNAVSQQVELSWYRFRCYLKALDQEKVH